MQMVNEAGAEEEEKLLSAVFGGRGRPMHFLAFSVFAHVVLLVLSHGGFRS